MRAAAAAILLLASTAALADALPATISPDHVKLGEPFVEEIVVPHAPGKSASLRAPTALGDFSLLGVERHEESGTTTLRARLALYRLGAHTLPPLTVDVGGRSLSTAPASVTGVSTLAAGAKTSLADVHAPIALTRLSRWLIAGAAALFAVLIAAGALVARAFARRRTLEARTLRALDGLAAELDAGAPPYAWWSALATILRRYVGARAGIDTLERTTHELGGLLAARALAGVDVPALTAWLEQADLVKFARDASDVDSAGRALAFGRALVAATTPKKGDSRARLALS